MNIIALIDPSKKFENLNKSDLMMSLGYIPGWVVNQEFFEKPLKEALDLQYGFGMFEMTGGEVTEDGVYKYPQDPDLYPLIKITRGEETLYQYQYGIVAIVQKDGSAFVTRMD